MDKLAHGWSPEEIHFQHSHLSLAQIHAAFAYYYEHQDEMDREIMRQVEEIEKLSHEFGQYTLVLKYKLASYAR